MRHLAATCCSPFFFCFFSSKTISPQLTPPHTHVTILTVGGMGGGGTGERRSEAAEGLLAGPTALCLFPCWLQVSSQCKPPSTCPLCSLFDGFMARRGSVCLALVKAAVRGLVKKKSKATLLPGYCAGAPVAPRVTQLGAGRQAGRTPSLAPSTSDAHWAQRKTQGGQQPLKCCTGLHDRT